MGDQQSVEFLDEADGLFTAQGVLDQALMGVLFVDHQFDGVPVRLYNPWE